MLGERGVCAGWVVGAWAEWVGSGGGGGRARWRSVGLPFLKASPAQLIIDVVARRFDGGGAASTGLCWSDDTGPRPDLSELK